METSKRSKSLETEKSKSGISLDRLSELPDSLIFHIFWLLPMSDVVRTTILSHRWKNLWTTAPNLNFEDFMIHNTIDRVRNFVYRALMFWKGTRIQQFAIDFGTLSNKSLYRDINLWVQFAKENEVEALYVNLEYAKGIIPKGVGAIEASREKLYWVPQCLYSCSSLKKLYLKGCNLHIPMKNVNLNQLKHLRIDGYELSEDLIKRALSGCPKLEVLILYLMENHGNLCIESSTLKNLFIYKYLYFEHDDVSVETELRILTPNLEKLDISGVPYSKCLINVPSLTRANLLFDAQSFYSHQLFCGNDFVGETLRQILPSIQHVEEVALSDWCIKALGAMKNIYTLSPFPNVKVLQLNGRCFEEHEQILDLLEIFPKLKTLVHQHENGNKKYYVGEWLVFLKQRFSVPSCNS